MLFGPNDIAGALGYCRFANLILQPSWHLAIMDETVGAGEDVGSDPHEGVIFADDNDRARIKSQMTNDSFRNCDLLGLTEMLCCDRGNMDDQTLGAVADRNYQAWPCLSAILAPGIGFVTPEIAVMDDITRDRLSP